MNTTTLNPTPTTPGGRSGILRPARPHTPLISLNRNIENDGTVRYLVNNTPHRDGGLPAVTRPDGTREYWEDGVLKLILTPGQPR